MKTTTHRFGHALIIALLLFLPVISVQAKPGKKESQPSLRQNAPLVASMPSVSAIYNTNLVPDGDAEVTNYSASWVDNEHFTLIEPYGAACVEAGTCHFPSPYDPGPAIRGNNFFFLGATDNHSNGNNLWLKTRISLAAIQSSVNTGKVPYIFSGYFGGDSTQTDAAQLQMFFETSGGAPAGPSVIVGNVSPADRQNKTGLLYREKTGFIPAGTQYINMALQSGMLSGSHWRTGYADNLSLILLPMHTYMPQTVNGPPALPPQTGFPAPTGVFVTPNGLTRMDIYWTDNSSNELGFEVQRINADSTTDTVCNTKPTITYCIDPGISQSAAFGYIYLGSSKTYTYQVRAVGPGINSAWANGTGTTATQPLIPPSATHGGFTCQAIDTTSTSTTFVWNDPFNYEAGFNIYVGSNSYPSWSMLEKGTKISFINQVAGSITLKIKPFVFDRTNPSLVYESSTSCTATAVIPSPPASGITRFTNNASYPVISLVVDGWEQFPVRPLGILSGAYYELDGVPSGTHNWTATTGFWDDWGHRFTMYVYTGSYSQPGSGPITINIPDMIIQDLLSVPPANLGYWEGYYFDANANCFTTAFKFKQDGTYAFFNANTQVDTGTYSLVKREPDIFSVKFHVTSSQQNVDGLLIETHGQFFMKNGPPFWQQITYVYKPDGYVRNPFCP